ncbi:MAG: alpha/beta hydrolase fold domain-containing protein [Sulfitobacter sp.]
MKRLLLCLALLAALGQSGAAQPDKTHRNLAYGDHPEQRLDLYLPAAAGPAPFVIYIHGGGWWGGSKDNVSREDVAYFTRRNIAFAAIDYRSLTQASDAGMSPPLLGPLHDSARALQFLRLHGAKYGLDPHRAAVYGASSGGFNALWLGLHPDQADLGAPDPVLRMSTRVSVVGAVDAQTSIDPVQMRAWAGPELRYGGHAFGLDEADFEGFLAQRSTFAPAFDQLSPAALIHPAAPPVHLLYTANRAAAERTHLDFVHSPGFGAGFLALALERGLPASLTIAARSGSYNRRAFLAQLAEGIAP